MDPDTNRNWGYKTFKKYLEDRGACDACINTVDHLYERYANHQAHLYQTKKPLLPWGGGFLIFRPKVFLYSIYRNDGHYRGWAYTYEESV